MPKFLILSRTAPDRVEATLPPAYRTRVRGVLDPRTAYTVVLFRGDVVTSAPVRRALAKIPTADAVVAVGGNFTAEAVALLEERTAVIVRLGEFYWTDESYDSLPR